MENILKEFAQLNKIPRQSHHEEKVASYLQKRGESLGLNTVKDDLNNVIMEVPATKGYEDVPLAILQAHMDMVCVGGPEYNPLTDAIIMVNDGKTLKAKGTSLGADDGMGVAMILALLTANYPHGPLRAIFTSDEEAGMSGAQGLDNKYLEGKYLINLDWEDDSSICIGCAGCLTVEYKKAMADEPIEGKGFSLKLSGLKGGHSGCEIHENRANAIKLMGKFLAELSAKDILFSIAAINGGKALNVIAPEITAEVIVSETNAAEVKKLFTDFAAAARKEFPNEKDMKFAICETPVTEGFSFEDSRDIALFLGECPHGVKEMSTLAEDAVSTSNNLALINSIDGVWLLISYRSDEDAKMQDFANVVAQKAAKYGFTAHEQSQSPAWTPKSSSSLESLANVAYQEKMGKAPIAASVHAGLECCYFAVKNPELDMISIGPLIKECHSVNETVYLDTLPAIMDWFVAILRRLK